MPKLTIEVADAAPKTVEVPSGKRLINALIDEGGTDQLHACGGVAKCTTCRVQFVAGEPSQITEAEKAVAVARGLDKMPGVRLSCQMNCDGDMSVKVISRLQGSGRADAGKRPTDEIAPPPVWAGKN